METNVPWKEKQTLSKMRRAKPINSRTAYGFSDLSSFLVGLEPLSRAGDIAPGNASIKRGRFPRARRATANAERLWLDKYTPGCHKTGCEDRRSKKEPAAEYVQVLVGRWRHFWPRFLTKSSVVSGIPWLHLIDGTGPQSQEM